MATTGTDTAQQAAFMARLAGGAKIEADDWMPDDYRQGALQLVLAHAASAIMGALPEKEWAPRAPSLQRKLAMLAKVQDKVGHGQLLMRVAEDLARPEGVSREDLAEDLLAGRVPFDNVFHLPVPTWADAGIMAWLADGAAVVRQGSLLGTSYGPYARVLRRICAEEVFHIQHGESICFALAEGSPAQRQLLQAALNRWWPALLQFFGPPNRDGDGAGLLLRYGLKVNTNDELRQKFLSKYIPAIHALGLQVPDPALRFSPGTGRYIYTEPDWDQYAAVVRGDGPLSAERLNLRRASHEGGRWVREALLGGTHPAA